MTNAGADLHVDACRADCPLERKPDPIVLVPLGDESVGASAAYLVSRDASNWHLSLPVPSVHVEPCVSPALLCGH